MCLAVGTIFAQLPSAAAAVQGQAAKAGHVWHNRMCVEGKSPVTRPKIFTRSWLLLGTKVCAGPSVQTTPSGLPAARRLTETFVVATGFACP